MNSSDNLPSYPPDNHHSSDQRLYRPFGSDDVYGGVRFVRNEYCVKKDSTLRKWELEEDGKINWMDYVSNEELLQSCREHKTNNSTASLTKEREAKVRK